MTNNLSSDSIIHSNPKDSIMVRGLKRVDFGFIPEDWLCLTLSEICELTSSKRIFESDYVSDGIPFYRGQEISSLLLGKRIEDVIYIDKDKFEKLKAKFGAPEQGDILITAVGTLGNSFLVNNDEPFYFKDGNLIWARKIKNTNPRFLIALLEFNKQRVLATAIGSSQKALTMAALNPLQLPIPSSPAEQSAIANALSDVDALIQELEKLIAKKQAIKTATMQQLLTGRTRLPQFAHHPDGRKKGYKPSELGEIPEDWEVTDVGSLCDLLTGYPFPSNKYSATGVRLLRGSNVKRGCTDWSEDITQYWPEKTSAVAQYELQVGDIVISMDGSLVGRSFAQLSEKDLPALLLQRVARLRSSGIEQGFLKEWICSKFFTEHCDSVKTVTAIPHISPLDIRTFKLLLPPTSEEQTIIANILSDMDGELESLNHRLTKTRQIKQGMMQELLTGKTRLVKPAGSHTDAD